MSLVRFVMIVCIAAVACKRETGAPRDAAIARRDAAVAPPSDAVPVDGPDTSLAPDDWRPMLGLSRDASRLGVLHEYVPFEGSAELAGVTFRYTRHAWNDATLTSRFRVIAERGGVSISHDFTNDAEIVVFDTAFMIDGYWTYLFVGHIEEPRSPEDECSAFDLAQLWGVFNLGEGIQAEYFRDLPDGARVSAGDGLAHVDYRGVRVSCGKLSGRMFAEHLPIRAIRATRP